MLANAQPDIIADQFNTVVQHFLDTQAPSTQHQVTHCHHLPWYSMKQERCLTERCWLFSGLTIHKETMNSKHKISPPFTVLKSTVKKLYIYILTNNLLDKITSTQLPSAYPTVNFHRSFLTSSSTRFTKPVIPLTARLFIPLCTVLWSVISLVHALCGFESH